MHFLIIQMFIIQTPSQGNEIESIWMCTKEYKYKRGNDAKCMIKKVFYFLKDKHVRKRYSLPLGKGKSFKVMFITVKKRKQRESL